MNTLGNTSEYSARKAAGIAIFVALIFAGCNRNNTASVGDGSSGLVASGYCSGYINSVYDPSRNVCVDPNTGSIIGNAILPHSLSFYSQAWDGNQFSMFPQYIYGYAQYVPQRNMTITNTSVFRDFLKKAMSVCDAGQSNYGTADCSAWINGGFDIVFQVPTLNANTMRITFRSWPQQNPYFTYTGSFPSAGQLLAAMFGFPVFSRVGIYRNPLTLDFTVNPINNSKGFEGRGYGDVYTLANRSLIQVQVATGKFENTSFTHQIAFEGQVFATGQFKKCVTFDCGASDFFGN